MFRKYSWILYSAVLFLVSSAAFAASNPAAPTISADAVTNQTDLSINFLGQIFGTVGNVLVGTSGQMLGKLFYEFNVGILVVASLWLSYSVLTIVLGSASEGSFMGKQNNIAYTFLRIAIGMGALIPSPTTGYCVIQDIVMEVVVEGVALADMTWTNGINYIQTGGAVWTPPAGASGGVDLSPTIAAEIFDGGNGIVKQVFADEVCMNLGTITAQLASEQNTANQQSAGGITNPPGSAITPISPYDNQANQSFDFSSDVASVPTGSGNTSVGCGSINWGGVTGADLSTATNNNGIAIAGPEATYAYQATYQVVYGMLPVSKEYVCTLSNSFAATSFCQNVNTSTSTQDMVQASFSGLLGYVNAITPLAKVQSNNASQNLTNFFASVNSQGWVMAGRYSWDLAHLQDQYQNALDLSNYLPPTGTPSVAPTANFFTKNWGSNTTPFMNQITTTYLPLIWSGAPSSTQGQNTVLTLFNNYSNGSQAGNTGNTNGSYGSNSIINDMLGGLSGDIGTLIGLFSSNNIGSDPLYFMHRVGIMCMGVAGDIWIGIALIVGGLYVVGIFCSGGTLDLDKPIQGVVDWVKPILMAVALVLIGTGGMLAYYVPVYAFFLFTFAVIGWFIAVIEAIACAPMIAFGLTHPEGHDLLGSAKQALILLLGVFLRPTLIIIGLVGGMILSFVAFRMVNYGFASFLGDIWSGPSTSAAATNASVETGISTFVGNAGNSEGGFGGIVGLIIGFPIMMTMYTGVAFLVANQCYSLIYVLPDYILRWIGGQRENSGVQQAIEGIKTATSQSSSSMGEGFGKSSDAISSRKKEKDESGSKDVDGKGSGDGGSGGGAAAG